MPKMATILGWIGFFFHIAKTEIHLWEAMLISWHPWLPHSTAFPKFASSELSECPPTTSRHYKEYVDKSGYLCYKGFAVGCESINQTARACKSTYSKKMDTDTYFWMPEYWRSKEKYHICSSHVECLNYMKAEDKRFTGDFLPCPPNNIG